MLTFGGGRLFLVAGATDMRKSFNGLAGIVREKLEADPMSRHLFFFCNRGRNRLKVLVADESGMWVLSKRLDRGTFAWPGADDGVTRVEYRAEQLALLLHGFDAERLRARPWKRRFVHSP
ncbi:IS66 family insertion sequence element accessory protein TnpB [Accumulibacter sp.]|uniref:IS66 family insertion sequence element accessory protein TnpB n=1 Tax=Accumulibacter sp. TaxID=2053492 RepID=UPI0035B254D9